MKIPYFSNDSSAAEATNSRQTHAMSDCVSPSASNLLPNSATPSSPNRVANVVIARALRGNRNEQRHSFFNGLETLVSKDRILESACGGDHAEDGGTARGDVCQLCRFERQLGLPHLPEMVFPHNSLVIVAKGKCGDECRTLIEFNAFDALKCVEKEHLPDVKVGPSEVWQSARRDLSLRHDSVHAFDWTFTSDYQGTVGIGIKVEKAGENERIDYERLKRRDPIEFYEQITLYEDELADNGCAQMTVRIRVMHDTFFVLCRFYLRIDNVMVRVCDTRLYGTAENKAFALRESTRREANYADLSKEAVAVLLDPNQITSHLPLEHVQTTKILYN
uniref:TIP41-like protein n=1 Tax=Globodera rostochiensis TaxID=31243 RepID=A0A914HIQ1_GLORO